MKNRSISLALVSIVLLMALFLSACSPAATPQSPASQEEPASEQATEAPEAEGEKAVVTYWHSMSNPETAQLEKVIEAFEAAHPDIDIQATRYSSDNDSFKNAVLTALTSKTFPDAARMDIVWVAQYAAEGVLMALDENLPEFDRISKEVFPGPLSTAYYNGHYYGLPLNTNTQVLLWNKGVFEAAGLTVAPTTIDEFVQVACDLSDPSQEIYGYAQGGTYFWAPAPLFFSMGGKIVDEEVTTATGYINGPESVAAFTLFKEMYDQGCLSPNLMGGGIATDAGHGEGKYAMIIDGPWMVGIYQDMYPDFEVNFALVPAGEGGTSSVVGGEDLVVFEGAKNKEATFEWVTYLMSPEAQKMMAEVGVMPTLASLAGDPSLPDYFGVFMEQLKTAQARTPHPKWQQMDDAINQAYQRILLGEADPQASLDQAAEEINALLK